MLSSSFLLSACHSSPVSPPCRCASATGSQSTDEVMIRPLRNRMTEATGNRSRGITWFVSTLLKTSQNQTVRSRWERVHRPGSALKTVRQNHFFWFVTKRLWHELTPSETVGDSQSGSFLTENGDVFMDVWMEACCSRTSMKLQMCRLPGKLTPLHTSQTLAFNNLDGPVPLQLGGHDIHDVHHPGRGLVRPP